MNKLEPILIFNQSMHKQDVAKHHEYTISYFTSQGIHKTRNEDSLLVFPLHNHAAVLAVADGVGSAQHAQEASSKLLLKLRQQLEKLTKGCQLVDLQNCILDTLNKMNQEMATLTGYLTTITICALYKNTLQVFQIGDSALILCGQRGKLKYKTTSHSPVGYAVESGILDDTEAYDHPESHLVDNLMGNQIANIEMSTPISLKSFDTILLATDGLLDNFLLTEIIETIRKGSINQVSASLTNYIKEQNNPFQKTHFIKDDDTSFILCRLAQH